MIKNGTKTLAIRGTPDTIVLQWEGGLCAYENFLFRVIAKSNQTLSNDKKFTSLMTNTQLIKLNESNPGVI